MAVEAHVNHGRWIALCSRPHCTSAAPLKPGQTGFHCVECNQLDSVVWPTDAEAIDAVLAMRPVPTTRNWAPPGHWQSIAVGMPEGQTVDELRAENRQYGVEVPAA